MIRPGSDLNVSAVRAALILRVTFFITSATLASAAGVSTLALLLAKAGSDLGEEKIL
jgi:hypothetical protein